MLRTGDKIDSFTLVRQLGKGSFGVVWLAEERTKLARAPKVALKIALEDRVEISEVEQEAELWVEASGHVNVLPILSVRFHEDQIIIVSEYAPDGSLEQWFSKHNHKAASIEGSIDLMLGILGGLEHLHSKGIIHRDLKPANILLQGGTPRLTDFGLARLNKASTHSMNAAGTLSYMAPEVFSGERSEQSDIWAAGVIFYQLLTGELPFPQTDLRSLISAIDTYEPSLPLSVPEPLRQIIAKALSKLPGDRYESAAAMRSALRTAQPGVMSSTLFSAEFHRTSDALEAPSHTANRANEISTPRDTIKAFPFSIQWRDAKTETNGSQVAAIAKKRRKLWLVGGGVLFFLLLVSAFPATWFVKSKLEARRRAEAMRFSVRGDASVNRTQYAEAEAEYRRAIILDPQNAIYHLKLAFGLEMGKGDWSEIQSEWSTAEQLARLALQARTNESDNHCTLGKSLSEQGKYSEGEAEFREGIRLNPNNADSHHDFAFYNLFSQGRNVEAEMEVRTAISLNPNYFDYHDTLSQILNSQGKNSDAELASREAIRLNPLADWPYAHLGEILWSGGKCEEALGAYADAIKRSSRAESEFGIASVFYGQRKYSEEEKRYRRAISLDARLPAYHANLARLLVDEYRAEEAKTEFTEAESAFRDSFNKFPHQSENHSALGDFLYEQKRYDEAQREYETAIRMEPEIVGYHYGLAAILKSRKRAEASAEISKVESKYRELIALKPNEADFYVQLASFLVDQEKYDEARKLYARASGIHSNDPYYPFVAGSAFFDKGQYKDAADQFQQAVTLSPGNDLYHFKLGFALSNLKQLGRAETEYRKALEIRPTAPDYHYYLGFLLYVAKKYDKSETEYRAAINLNPVNGEYHNALGNLFFTQGQYPAAENEYRKATELLSWEQAVWENLSGALRMQHKQGEAQQALKKSKTLSHGDERPRANSTFCR